MFRVRKNQGVTEYKLYSLHNVKVEITGEEEKIVVGSIDPGKNNFSIRVEERDRVNGVVTALYHDVWKIGGEGDNIVIITDLLDGVMDLLNECNIIIVEGQMATNYQMTRLAQHVITYLIAVLRNNEKKTLIVELSSKIKNKYFIKAPAKTSYNDLKKITVSIVTQLCIDRDDKIALSLLKRLKKKDDACDVIAQIEAFMILIGLD